MPSAFLFFDQLQYMSSGKVIYVSKTTWDKLQMFRMSDDESPGDLVRHATNQALARKRVKKHIPQYEKYADPSTLDPWP